MTPLPNDPGQSLDPNEDQFVQLLLELDQRPANGQGSAAARIGGQAADDAVRERLVKAENCLRMLWQLWPHPTATASLARPNASSANHGRAYARFGRYEIVRELGRGGHGVVFLAEDPALKRRVALKVPRPEVLSSVELSRRFVREAEAAARLDHPNIVPIFEVGTDGPVCFTAAAYCDGGTLQDWLAGRDRPLPPRMAAQLVAELASAVHHAHSRGVLHRDLKPSNILLVSRSVEASWRRKIGGAGKQVALEPSPAPNPTPGEQSLLDDYTLKIADFGLAKVVDSDQDSTMKGVVLGTANYMAPEQAAGRPGDVGVTADVYSLGVILYELLAGAAVFQAEGAPATAGDADLQKAAWPDRGRAPIPADLRTVYRHCLETDPGRRYPSAAALAADLRRFLDGEPIAACSLGLAERARRIVLRHPALIALAILAACLAVGFVLLLYRHNRDLAQLNLQLSRQVAESDKLTRAAQRAQQSAEKQAAANRRHHFASKLRLVQESGDATSPWHLTEALHETLHPEDQDFREFAWRYWWRRCRHSEVFVLPGHGQFVRDAVFSPDGRLIATASSDATVRVWDVETGRELTRLHGMADPVNKVAFSPGGNRLAAANCRGVVKVWSTADWRPMFASHAHAGEVPGLVFSSEETLISGGLDGWLRTWDLRTQRQSHEFQLNDGRQVQSLAVAGGSGMLVIGASDGSIELRPAPNADEQPKAILRDPGPNVLSISVSQLEDRAAVSDASGCVQIWDLAARKLIRAIECDTDQASPAAISTDGRRIAVVAEGGHVQVLDAATGGVLYERSLDLDDIGALAFSKNGDAVLAAGSHGKMVLWQPFEARPQQPVGHAKETWAIAFAPDGRSFVTGSDDQTVREWETVSGNLLREMPPQRGTVAALAYSPDGSILASTCLAEVSEQPDSVRLHDAKSWKLLAALPGHSGKVYSVAFHPGGEVLATGSTEVILWDVKLRARKQTLSDSAQTNKKVKSIAFSWDGSKLAFASEDGRAYLYDYPSLRRRAALECGDEVWAVAFSPNGKHLAAGCRDGSVIVWDTHASTRLHELKGHLQGVRSVAYTHDARTIATGSHDETIKLWDPATGQALCTLHGHSSQVFGLAFSRDNQWLASCSFDGGVRLWHAPHVRIGNATLAPRTGIPP